MNLELLQTNYTAYWWWKHSCTSSNQMVSCTTVHPIVSREIFPVPPPHPFGLVLAHHAHETQWKASRESSIFGWKQGNNNHRPKNHLSITYPPSFQLPFNEWLKERIDIALQDFSGFVGCSTRQILKAASFKMRGKCWWEILKKWKLPIDIWKKSLSIYVI